MKNLSYFLISLLFAMAVHSNSQELEWVMPGSGQIPMQFISHEGSDFIGIIDADPSLNIFNINGLDYKRLRVDGGNDRITFNTLDRDTYDQIFLTPKNTIIFYDYDVIAYQEYDLEKNVFSSKLIERNSFTHDVRFYFSSNSNKLYRMGLSSVLGVNDYNSGKEIFSHDFGNENISSICVFETNNQDFFLVSNSIQNGHKSGYYVISADDISKRTKVLSERSIVTGYILDVEYIESINTILSLESYRNAFITGDEFYLYAIKNNNRTTISDKRINNKNIALNSDSSITAYSYSNNIELYDLNKMEVISTHLIKDIAVNLYFVNDYLLRVICRSGLVFDYDYINEKIVTTHSFGNGHIRNLKFSEDKEKIFIYTYQRPRQGIVNYSPLGLRITVFEPANKNVINYHNIWPHPDIINVSLIEDNEGNILYIEDTKIKKWNYVNDQVSTIFESADTINNFAFDESKNILYVILSNNRVQIVDYYNNQILNEINTKDEPRSGFVMADNIYISETEYGKYYTYMRKYDLKTSERVCIYSSDYIVDPPFYSHTYDYSINTKKFVHPPEAWESSPFSTCVLELPDCQKRILFGQELYDEPEFKASGQHVSLAKNSNYYVATHFIDNIHQRKGAYITLWDYSSNRLVSLFDDFKEDYKHYTFEIRGILLDDSAESYYYGTSHCTLGKVRTEITSVNEAKNSIEEGLLLFPNPSNEEISFELTTSSDFPTTYKIYDLMGRFVMQGTAFPGINKINISEFQKGLYLIKFRLENDKYRYSQFLKN